MSVASCLKHFRKCYAKKRAYMLTIFLTIFVITEKDLPHSKHFYFWNEELL